MKTSFSGHEKFECKASWLPLASKDINAIFGDIETSISLTGIGSNKVKSLRQWMHKFSLLDENKFTHDANTIFSHDPYLEKVDSLWILHTYLSQNFEKATLYFLFFNQFFMSNFTKESLLYKLQSWCENKDIKMSENTLESDVNVLIKMYLKNDENNGFSNSIFNDLNIIHKVEHEYIVNVKNPAPLSDEAFLYLFLYSIRDCTGNTISVKDLQFGQTSLQYMLCLTEERLLDKLERLSTLTNNQISYQEAAGIKQIYISNKPDIQAALIDVYK